jgi:hypothetical protein
MPIILTTSCTLAKAPTECGNADQDRVTRRLLMFFGDRADPMVRSLLD